MSESINIEIDICWENAPDWANFIAMDEDGKWHFFSHQPSLHPHRNRWTLGQRQEPIENLWKIIRYLNFKECCQEINSYGKQDRGDDFTDEELASMHEAQKNEPESIRRGMDWDELKYRVTQQSILRRLSSLESKLLEVLMRLAPSQLQAETAADNSVS